MNRGVVLLVQIMSVAKTDQREFVSFSLTGLLRYRCREVLLGLEDVLSAFKVPL